MARQGRRPSALAGAVLAAGVLAAGSAGAQKTGGVLKMYLPASPASLSIHEETSLLTDVSMMGVFNNLVVFDQHVPQTSLASIVPDLATRWAWDKDGTALTFSLRQGVKWHDGKPFTAADVKCTWDLLTGRSEAKLRVDPRKSWYRNLDAVTTNGDYEVTFRLKQKQPAFLINLAGGLSPVYPCHVPPREMRQHPIGTGPYKFVEFKPNEDIKLARNPDYWKEGRPYLDGIDYTVVPNLSTAMLAFVAGKFDMAFPYSLSVQLAKEVKSQKPQVVCQTTPGTINRNLLINRRKPPFDNPDLRQAMALSLDRKAFIDIIGQGQGDLDGIMRSPPAGLWGMPLEMLQSLPGYGPDVEKNRTEARQIMQRLGYGPEHRLAVKIATQDLAPFRDPAVILIDQLKNIYIDGELETIDAARWLNTLRRGAYSVALNLEGSGVDPDLNLYRLYGCKGELNYNGYCNPAVDDLLDQQSRESDPEARKQMIWHIQRKIAEDFERPIIFYTRETNCWQPQVKNLTLMVTTLFDGWRMEDLWLDR